MLLFIGIYISRMGALLSGAAIIGLRGVVSAVLRRQERIGALHRVFC